jgi:hypothetical protein
MKMVGDVKCYHCGHVSGEVEGTRTDRLVFHTFKPRPGYRGTVPGPGARIRCERCQGPVFLEDLRPAPPRPQPIAVPTARKRAKSSRTKAA